VPGANCPIFPQPTFLNGPGGKDMRFLWFNFLNRPNNSDTEEEDAANENGMVELSNNKDKSTVSHLNNIKLLITSDHIPKIQC
jgi:hypothetical protein